MTRRRPLIFGHRGGNEGRPNSAGAVRRAAAAGADGVEIDVQLAPDGRLIAEHDPLALGRDFAGDVFADVLAAAVEADLRLLVDFKSTGNPGAEAAALVSAFAQNAEGRRRVIVSSFDMTFLEAFANVAPEMHAMPIISLRQNFFRMPDLDRWAGVSVLAAAMVVHPVLAWRARRTGNLFIWFGATEWSVLKVAMTRFGADALILKQLARRAARHS